MSTGPVLAEASSDDLLRVVERLSEPEFERFVAGVLALRAGRSSSRLSAVETSLLQRINAGLPEPLHRRYDALIARRDARALSDAEQDELRRLTDEVESVEASRASALAELAAHRGVTLTALMDALGLSAPGHG